MELGEIEHALRAQAGVVEAVVLLDKGADALVAYVSPSAAIADVGENGDAGVTAFASVPFFAVPAAMLTWGFEGEAERLAGRERKK